jgi:hypothetical protein
VIFPTFAPHLADRVFAVGRATARASAIFGAGWAAPTTCGLSSRAGRMVRWAEAVGRSQLGALFNSFPILIFSLIFLKIIQISKIHRNVSKIQTNTK